MWRVVRSAGPDLTAKHLKICRHCIRDRYPTPMALARLPGHKPVTTRRTKPSYLQPSLDADRIRNVGVDQRPRRTQLNTRKLPSSPSEGRGHRFEFCRVRHLPHEIIELFGTSFSAVSRGVRRGKHQGNTSTEFRTSEVVFEHWRRCHCRRTLATRGWPSHRYG